MSAEIKWTLVDFFMNMDQYLNAMIDFIIAWRTRNPNSWDIMLLVLPPSLVWFVMKTPWTWDESILKRFFDKINIEWPTKKKAEGGSDEPAKQ